MPKRSVALTRGETFRGVSNGRVPFSGDEIRAIWFRPYNRGYDAQQVDQPAGPDRGGGGRRPLSAALAAGAGFGWS